MTVYQQVVFGSKAVGRSKVYQCVHISVTYREHTACCLWFQTLMLAVQLNICRQSNTMTFPLDTLQEVSLHWLW